MTNGREKYKSSGLVRSPDVSIIGKSQANNLLDKYHYLGGVRTASRFIGHSQGCTVWGVMRSRAWHKRLVEAGFRPIELIRMVGKDGHSWAMSSLLAKSIKFLEEYDLFVTYADPMQYHNGAVYLAANWKRVEQDSQPDGYLWKLDGNVVSRKLFYAKHGTSKIAEIKRIYGDRVTLELDVPKKRFYLLKDIKRNALFTDASTKVKTWGSKRSIAWDVMESKR